MKTFNIVMKILAVLAVIAGIAYVVVTYGDQIVAWFKKVSASLPKCPRCEKVVFKADAAKEVVVKETPVEEEAVEVTIEVPTEDVSETDAVAEETDFEA